MPIEEQLLPNKALKPYYKKITWLYVCRTFKKTPKDLEALRTHDRFGISLWPQMFVFDPKDDRVLKNTPRTLKGFMAVFDAVLEGWKRQAPADGAALAKRLAEARALHKKGRTEDAIASIEPLQKQRDPGEAWLDARELLRAWRDGSSRKLEDRLTDPDPRERAMALEGLEKPVDAATRSAKGFLGNEEEDIVVRIRALRYLARVSPPDALFHARELLRIANDPLRYEVLALIQQHPEEELIPVLVELFRSAGSSRYPSRNPNVVRIRTAQCLGKIGDHRAVSALALPARKCNPNNGLTRVVFQALGDIGSRCPPVYCAQVARVLVASLPRPAAELQKNPKYLEGMERRCLYLARELVKSLEKAIGMKVPVEFPKQGWTAEDRARVHAAMKKAITVR